MSGRQASGRRTPLGYKPPNKQVLPCWVQDGKGKAEAVFCTDTWEYLNGKFSELNMTCTHYHDHGHPFRVLT